MLKLIIVAAVAVVATVQSVAAQNAQNPDPGVLARQARCVVDETNYYRNKLAVNGNVPNDALTQIAVNAIAAAITNKCASVN